MSESQSQPTPVTEEKLASEGYSSWYDYWTVQGMPWRTEPEIDAERQEYLAERRARELDIWKGVYPFRDENGSIKLDRGDVEWLLATHESDGIRGPVDVSDEKHQKRVGLDLRGADLSDMNLSGLPLSRLLGGLVGNEDRVSPVPWLNYYTEWDYASAGILPEWREYAAIQLSGARLQDAELEQAYLYGAYLKRSDLRSAHLQEAKLRGADLRGTDLREADIAGADLSRAKFDEDTRLDRIWLAERSWVHVRRRGVALADVRWGGVNLTAVSWEELTILGDEIVARRDSRAGRLAIRQFEVAARANQQLATVLRNQALNDQADRFAYRAHLCHRQVLRRHGRIRPYLGSLFLDLISGYGYRPMRSLYTYVFTIGVFAFLYWAVTNDISFTFGWFTHLITWLGMSPPPPSTTHLQGYEAVVVSMTSFHGRGFFQPVQSPGDKVAILAAIEAFFGLLLEIVLIATFTQRFFAR